MTDSINFWGDDDVPLNRPPANPDSLAKFTIDHDRWDKADLDRILKEFKEFRVEGDMLAEHIEETGFHLWGDTYRALNKVDPKMLADDQVRQMYLVNKAVLDELLKLDEYHELREMGCEGDDVAAAMGAITMRPKLEEIYDKLQKAQELAKQLEEAIKEWIKAQQDQGGDDDGEGEPVDGCFPGGTPGTKGEGRQLIKALMQLAGQSGAGDLEKQQQDFQANKDKLEEARKKAEEAAANASKDLSQELERQKPAIRRGLKEGLDDAIAEAEDLNNFSDTWSNEPGSLQRLDAQQRINLAKKFGKGNDKLKKMLDLVGPMRRYMLGRQRTKVTNVPEEIYDIGLGDELPRVLSQEFAGLDDPLLELDFFRKLSERELMQYEMRGTEALAKGGIIFCLDGSGSMAGDREVWGKAVGLCLLHLARQQKRSFLGIHFGSANEIAQYDFSKPEDYTPEKILGFAELFFNGGTNFQRPLTIALEHLQKEFAQGGCVKGDIVFATDGACGVPDQWLADFKVEQERLGFKVWAISIGAGYRSEPLNTIADGSVVEIGDLTSGQDIGDMFGGL